MKNLVSVFMLGVLVACGSGGSGSSSKSSKGLKIILTEEAKSATLRGQEVASFNAVRAEKDSSDHSYAIQTQNYNNVLASFSTAFTAGDVASFKTVGIPNYDLDTNEVLYSKNIYTNIILGFMTSE